MKLVNPAYNSVLIYLLKDLVIAKGLISRILDKEITELIPVPEGQPSEVSVFSHPHFMVSKFEYVAELKINEKNKQKVFIELYKAISKDEILRFDEKISAENHLTDEMLNLPKISIYIVEKAFNKSLPAIWYAKRQYYDVLAGKKYEGEKDPFIDLFGHDKYYIQMELLPKEIEDDLLRVLIIFSPHYKDQDDFYINLPDELVNSYNDPLLYLIVKRLLKTELGKSKDFTQMINSLKYEEETRKNLSEFNKIKQELKEDARKKMSKAITTLAKALKTMGTDIEEIMKETGLSREEIENL